MLPIANKPMISYGLEHLRNAGVKEVAVILGPIKEGVAELLGDGSSFGLKLSYISQPEPKGLANAVQLSHDFMDGDSFVMYLGDNLLKQGVGGFIDAFQRLKADCVVGVSPVENPSAFGIVEMRNGVIERMIEKPREPKSNLALIGVYVFGPAIFDAVNQIKPSFRNELEITDAIQRLIDNGKRVEVQKVDGWWKDTGRPEDLLEANQLVLSDQECHIFGEVSKEAQLLGRITLGAGSKVFGSSRIQGPAIIGNNCSIGPDVYIGPYTSIGDNCMIRNVEIENSIVMSDSQIETGKRIVDSLIGSHSTILDSSTTLPKGQKLIVGERSIIQI